MSSIRIGDTPEQLNQTLILDSKALKYIEELEHKLKVAEILTEEAQNHVRAVNLRLYELLDLEPDEVRFKWAALAVKEAVDKAKRYDYLKSLIEKEVADRAPSSSVDWTLNLTLVITSHWTTLSFDQALDLAIHQKSNSQQPKIPV